MQTGKKRLLDLVRDKVRFKHYSLKTECAYIGWIKRYIFYHNKRHPMAMGKVEIESFLSWLAADQVVSPLHKIKLSAHYFSCIEKFSVWM